MYSSERKFIVDSHNRIFVQIIILMRKQCGTKAGGVFVVSFFEDPRGNNRCNRVWVLVDTNFMCGNV